MTAPALCAGVVSVIEVALATITLVAATPPNVTVAPVVKSVPVSVTAVPPAVGPEVGLTVVTAGGATNVKPFGRLAIWPSRLVTTTVTAPALCAGVVSVIEVALTTITFVAATPPTVTVAPAVKSVPVSVTAVPPAAGPDAGLTVVTVGGAT